MGRGDPNNSGEHRRKALQKKGCLIQSEGCSSSKNNVRAWRGEVKYQIARMRK